VAAVAGSQLSSETVAMTTVNNGCPAAAPFRCVNTSICVPPSWLCDTINDCGDMSDEGPLAGCTGIDGVVYLYQYSCRFTTCVFFGFGLKTRNFLKKCDLGLGLALQILSAICHLLGPVTHSFRWGP